MTTKECKELCKRLLERELQREAEEREIEREDAWYEATDGYTHMRTYTGDAHREAYCVEETSKDVVFYGFKQYKDKSEVNRCCLFSTKKENLAQLDGVYTTFDVWVFVIMSWLFLCAAWWIISLAT